MAAAAATYCKGAVHQEGQVFVKSSISLGLTPQVQWQGCKNTCMVLEWSEVRKETFYNACNAHCK